MARIKVNDLAEDITISQEEMKKISGGFLRLARPSLSTRYNIQTFPMAGVRFGPGIVEQAMDEEEEPPQP